MLDITHFGALPDGQTLATQSIQSALDAARDQGGGTVFVPAGVFLTGSIFLHSQTELVLDHNAVLLASPRLEDYQFVRWGHHNDRTPWHLLNVLEAEHVVLRGSGRIDGNGPAFWEPEKIHEDEFWKARLRRPSPMIEISRSRDVTVRDLRLGNPPGWCLHLHDCEKVRVTGLSIRNNLLGPNSDGIDITGGRDIVISDCNIVSGDDGIALKTTRDSTACENITVTNCVIETNCLGIRVGYEARQDFRHCLFSNIVIKKCSRGIDIRAIEGSLIEHLLFQNITIRALSGWPLDRPVEIYVADVPEAFVLAEEHTDHGKSFPLAKSSALRHIRFSNISIESCGRILLGAVEGLEARDVVFDNVLLKLLLLDDPQPLADRAQGLSFAPELPEHRAGQAAICAEGITDLVLRGVRIEWPTYPAPTDLPILTSKNRLLHAEVWQGQEEARRQGKVRPVWSALRARRCPGLRVENSHWTASEGNASACDLDDQSRA
jgi:hypothetical protein